MSDRLEKLHKGFKTAKQKDTENKIIVTDYVSSHLEVGSVPWQQFDVERYVGATALRRGENPYHRNKFNQLESDKLKPDRNVMDTRHSQLVFFSDSAISTNFILRYFRSFKYYLIH